MLEYGKTENLLVRDKETHRLIPDTFRIPEVALVADGRWVVTEKIDGTNVRIILSKDETAGLGYRVSLKGRSDKANIPAGLDVWIDTRVDQLWEEMQLPDDVVVTFYGEAYGPGIQKGGDYGDEKRIAVFDLRTSRLSTDSEGGLCPPWTHAWRSYSEMKVAAEIVGLETVPEVFTNGELRDMNVLVGEGFASLVEGANRLAEGIVAKTDPYLFTGRGERVMFKLKTEDLKGLQ